MARFYINRKPNKWRKLLGVFLKVCKHVPTVTAAIKALLSLFS